MLGKKKSRVSGKRAGGSLTRSLSFLGVLVVLAGLVAAFAAVAPASGPPGLSQAVAAKDRHMGQLFAHPGVVGAGVGLDDSQAVVLVLTTSDRVAGLPQTLDGVKVDVRVTGPISALAATATGRVGPAGSLIQPEAKGGGLNPASYFSRPVPIGVSTGNQDQCLAGTIGARVKGGARIYALSNNHVYAEENAGTKGVTKVTQPGLYDLKGRNQCHYSTTYDLGTLSNFVPIVFSTDASNTVDAAIAATTTASLGRSTPPDGYGTPSSTTTTARLNMAVQKYGRTSALTHGSVCMIETTVNVSYTSGVARFVDQFGVCNGGFSRSGDSGSLIVTDDTSRRPVGLLFAAGGGITFANSISDVLSALSVSVDGS